MERKGFWDSLSSPPTWTAPLWAQPEYQKVVGSGVLKLEPWPHHSWRSGYFPDMVGLFSLCHWLLFIPIFFLPSFFPFFYSFFLPSLPLFLLSFHPSPSSFLSFITQIKKYGFLHPLYPLCSPSLPYVQSQLLRALDLTIIHHRNLDNICDSSYLLFILQDLDSSGRQTSGYVCEFLLLD